MRQLESSSFEELEGQPDGTRFFVVQVYDPETTLVFKGSIALDPDTQRLFSKKCLELSHEYEEVLPWVAAYRVLGMMWETPPEGHVIHAIEEVSKEVMLGRVREDMDRHLASAG
jgi:hypothetical protein